ncbi:MAG: NAD(P)-dependent oxidoreductase [Azospirillum sp.]|nr:NAD(P)-dependent oxidoreductase [Azospirillum sp.]
MRVALTGATGIAGAGIATALARAGHRVVAFGRREPAGRKLDLADPSSARALDWAGAKILIHAAGVTDETARDKELGPRIAIESWRALLDAGRAAGVGRVVYVSSAHVYGPLEGEIEEDAFPRPINEYARLHLASEQVLRTSGLAADILRACNLYGFPADLARFERWALIPYGFPRDAAREGRIVLKSPGQQARNFLSAERLGEIVVATLALPTAGWRVRNAVGRDTMSVREFAGRVAALAGAALGREIAVEAPPPDIAPPPLRMRGAWGDTGAAYDDLDGFLARMIAACAADRNGPP